MGKVLYELWFRFVFDLYKVRTFDDRICIYAYLKVVVETGTALEEEGTRKTEKEGEEGGGGGKSEGTKRGSREEGVYIVLSLISLLHNLRTANPRPYFYAYSLHFYITVLH